MTKDIVARALGVSPSAICTAEEAARMLGIQHRSVLKAAERGTLKGTNVGRMWYFTIVEIETYRRQYQE